MMVKNALQTRRFRQLHVDAVGGAAGDMLLAAFIDLGVDSELIGAAVTSLGTPGLQLDVSRVKIGVESACYLRSAPTAIEPHGRHLNDVMAIIEQAQMSATARQWAERIFTILAGAEAASHRETVDHVHLHEVGELDSILDVIGIAVAYDSLGSPPLTVGPLPSGRGEVLCRHGRLTLPVPAVQHIAKAAGLLLVDIDVIGETVTPTGAAVLAALGSNFGAPLAQPSDRCGIGAGTRRFSDRPNVVRLHGYLA